MKATPLVDRFWAKVDKSGECWLWTAHTDKDDYGKISSGPPRHTMLRAHRVSWEFAYGEIPEGLMVCHSCDNPMCVRPDHLWLGTTADNNEDMWKKGRNTFQKKGNPSQKLTEQQAVEIREVYAKGSVTMKVLSEKYGVHIPQISRIVNGVRWTHLDD